MKKSLLFFLLLLTTTTLWAQGYDFSAVAPSGQTLYYKINGDGTSVSVVTEKSSSPYYTTKPTGDLTIPSSVTYGSDTYTVTSIGNSAFSSCTGLTSVTIPNSVTSIGKFTFRGCTGLTSMNIPNSVTNIGDYIFYQCTGLTSVTISNSVTSIGDYAFYECKGLTSVTIPNSVTTIGEQAFYNCRGLTSITIPNSVTSIGDDAFNQCKKLTSITIPNSVTSIGKGVFAGCSGLTSITIPNSVTSIGKIAFLDCGLTSITIPNSVTSIGERAFESCNSLTSVTIPNSITRIEDQTFSACDKLTSITIPNSVTSIGNSAFYGCTNLTSITIPNSVTSIGNGAFSSCIGLTYVTIPNSVTSIGNNPFSNCSKLTTINVDSDNLNYKSIDGVLYSKDEHTLIGYPAGKAGYSFTIPNSVTTIGNSAFNGCTKLTSITIPNSVTRIGNSAFYGCTNLTSITIPNSVTSIGERAFYKCTYLTSVSISNSITRIEKYTFDSCKSLTSVTIPNSVTSIGYGAFYYCTGLTSVTIGNSVTSIGEIAFKGCSGLTSVTIPNSVKTIDTAAFNGCTGLTSITFPNSVTNIRRFAFISCEKLTSVTFGSSVTSIGEYAFYECKGLTSVTCEAVKPPILHSNSSCFSKYNIPLYVPCCSIEAYRKSVGWKKFATILPIDNTSHTISASANDVVMGSVSVSGSGTYNCGDIATLTATPNEGYHFVKWSDENTDITRDVTVTQDSTLTAIFAPNPSTCTVTIDVNDPSMGDVTGGGEYGVGETVTLIATPKEGYHFVKWSDENTDNPRTITVTGETNLTAIFAINTYTVTATTDDASMGSVTGGGTYNHGETATLTAIPKEGYHFVQWSDGNTDNARTVTATQDSVFTAIFAINTYTVTVAADDASKGSVTGGGTYNHGETATLKATPNAGYCFFGWSDGSTENPRGVTATQDSTITAIFDFKRRNHTATVCQGEAYSYQDSVFNTTTAGTFSKEVRFSNAYDCDSVVTVNLTVTAKSSATGIMLKDTCFEMGKATQLKVESPVASATYRFYDSHHALLHTGTEYTTAALSSEEVFYVTIQEPTTCESAEKSITISECVTPTHLFQLHKTVDNASVCKNSIVTITTVIEKLTPALIHKIQIIEDFGFADLKLLTAELKIDGKAIPYTRDVAHNKLFFNMGELSGIGTYTLTITARAFPNLGPKTETTTIHWANYPTGITETATFNVVD